MYIDKLNFVSQFRIVCIFIVIYVYFVYGVIY